MALSEHLEELRGRLIRALVGLAVGWAIALMIGNRLMGWLEYSYVKVMREMGLGDQLAIQSISTGMTVYLEVSLVAGVVLASPWIFYQLWMFVAAGLYPNERRIVISAIPFSAGLFAAGTAFFLFVASVPLIRFFAAFNEWLGVRPVIMLKDHIGFMTRTMLMFGLAFQTPLVVLILSKAGIVSLSALNKYRRHVIVGVLIFAAVVTSSPSPLDQIMLAIPIWLLYELGVGLSYLMVFRGRKMDE